MNKTSKPEVVVVTGASAGVGRATACAFARRGARVGLLARGRAGLEAARADVERLGGEALVVPTDVADAEQVEAAAAAVEEGLGPIDVWVNNAMCSVFSPVKQMTPADYKRVTEVTYLGYVHGALSALRRMLPRDRGILVQVGSALAFEIPACQVRWPQDLCCVLFGVQRRRGSFASIHMGTLFARLFRVPPGRTDMEQKSQVDDLVLTQAEPVPPPHPAAAPKPGPQNKGERGASEVDPAVLRELKTLAERVGGLEKLKEVVDILIRLPR